MLVHRYATAAWFALAPLVVGCAASQSVELASGFDPANRTVSVLGVFKDGHMSTEAWDAVEPRLSAVLGGHPCPALFTGRLSEAEPAVFAQIDDSVRAEGVTPELVREIAPRAEASLVLLVSIHGGLRLPMLDTSAPEGGPGAGGRGGMGLGGPPGGGMPGGGPGGGMGGAGPPGGGMPGGGPGSMGPKVEPSAPRDDRVLVIALTLFSTGTQQAVARLTTRYAGPSADDAFARFTEQIRTELPAASCAGWKQADRAAPSAALRLHRTSQRATLADSR